MRSGASKDVQEGPSNAVTAASIGAAKSGVGRSAVYEKVTPGETDTSSDEYLFRLYAGDKISSYIEPYKSIAYKRFQLFFYYISNHIIYIN